MNITFTGIDEQTSLPLLKEISDRDPRVEWGILYTHTPEGRMRYPSREWIVEAVQVLHGRCALHICGRGAREELLNAGLSDLTRYVSRVQINGNVSVETVHEALAIVAVGSGCEGAAPVITQHAAMLNTQLVYGVTLPGHELLVDASGGRGISPEAWRRPITSKAVGFAGGLGPGNVREEVRKMGSLVEMPGAWIDMEGKLRDSMDRFNLGRAEAILYQLESAALT